MPLNSKTRGLDWREKFALCKRGVRLVNCSRGGIIDETALLAALESGVIAGAAIDVFAKEPTPPNDPLVMHPRVIVTPHIGAATVEAQERVALTIARQLADALDGKPPVGLVNKV